MATTDNAALKQEQIVEYFCLKVYNEYNQTHQQLAKDGVLQVDRLYEMYEAIMHNTTVESVDYMDLASGEECKLRTMGTRKNSAGNDEYYFLVQWSEINNKTGDLLIGAVNHLNGTFDRFRIPYEFYSSRKANIWINLSLKGKGYGMYQQFLISSETYP